jgi:hypothetical protein
MIQTENKEKNRKFQESWKLEGGRTEVAQYRDSMKILQTVMTW